MIADWTLAETEALAALYAAKEPVNAIAERLNRDFHGARPVRNKNSVVGKMMRLRDDTGIKPASRNKRLHVAKSPEAPAKPDSMGCRWIDGDPHGRTKDPMLFCCRNPLPGASYCSEHQARAFVPAHKHKQALKAIEYVAGRAGP